MSFQPMGSTASKAIKKNISRMIKNYKKMGKINREMAEEGLISDSQAQKLCEEYISERDNCDCEKGRYLLR